MFEQKIVWRKAPPQAEFECEVGDSFLVAVRCCNCKDHSKDYWEFAVVTAEENGSFELDNVPWGRDWGDTEKTMTVIYDVQWYVPVKELACLPVL